VKKYASCAFLKVDICTNISEKVGIPCKPTILFIKKGANIASIDGDNSELIVNHIKMYM